MLKKEPEPALVSLLRVKMYLPVSSLDRERTAGADQGLSLVGVGWHRSTSEKKHTPTYKQLLRTGNLKLHCV